MANDVVIGLRVQAQLEQARSQLKSLQSEIDKLGSSNVTSAQQQAAANKAAAAAQSASAALKGYAQGIEQSNQKTGEAVKSQGALNNALRGVAGQVKSVLGSMGPLGSITGNVAAGFVKLAGPLTIVAGGVAALTAAYLAGQKEAQRYHQALVMTGNIAGQTAGQLQDMAGGISASVGSQREAADAITQLVNTGMSFGGNLQRYAETAVRAQRDLGIAVQETVANFEQLGKAPVQASLQLNERMNYLTASVLEQIRTLEEQGRHQEAATLAMNTFADAVNTRAPQVTQRLGLIERGWRDIKAAAEAAKDSVLNIGRDQTASDMLVAAQKELNQLQARYENFVKTGDTYQPRLDGLQEAIRLQQNLVDGLQRAVASEEKIAQREGEKVQAQRDATAASEEFNQYRLQALSNEERMALELEKVAQLMERIRAAGLDISQEDYDKVVQSIITRYTPKPTAPKVDQVAAAYQQQQLSMYTQLLQAQQRLEQAQAGITSSQTAATDALEIWLQTNEHAQKLDQARIATLREMAAQVDETTRRITEASKTQERDKRITEGLQEVQIQWLQATGQTAEATALQIEARFKQLREDLQASGNEGGMQMVDALAAAQNAQAQLQQLQQQSQQALSRQNQEEQTIQLRLESGLITEFESRRQILELHRQTADEVAALIPQMKLLAEATGDPQALERVKALALQIDQLRQQTNEFAQAAGKAFEESFTSAYDSILEGAESIRDVLQNLLMDFTKSIGRWAFNDLVAEAKSSLAGLFGGDESGLLSSLFGTATDTGEAAAATANTAALTAMTATTGTATGALAAFTAAVTAAAAAAATMAASSAASAAGAVGGMGEGIAGGLGSILGSLFDTGGYTGPGSKYQPAGIVHAGEYVLRSEVVKQPGMRALLDALNHQGIGALSRRFSFPGYADGGLVTDAAIPGYQPSSGTATGGPMTVDNQLSIALVQDPEAGAAWLGTRTGEKAMMTYHKRNAAELRQILLPRG